MKLTFHGGAGTVTGANYLLESDGHRILIDCGLLQGSNYAERQNFEPFAYDPSTIEAVIITHSHLDHVGRLPKLHADGFRGTIYSTPPTKDFAELILLDSEHILCKDAERESANSFCSPEHVEALTPHWQTAEYHQPFQIGPFRITFFNAGHIMGSAFIRVEAEGKTIVFSGDLGNSPAPIIQATEPLVPADYVLIESTYGDREHDRTNEREEDLRKAIIDNIRSGGTLLIPTFAMERTQDLLYHLNDLVEHGEIPAVPVFVDSPLAIKLTEAYSKYRSYFNKEVRDEVSKGDNILSFPNLHLTETTEESKGINSVPPPKIIIAGSGMSQGGRILHHEMRYLSDPKNMILFVGYQAVGSLGRMIMEGAPEVRIYGERVSVRAQKRSISAYSAHADQPHLLAWLYPLKGRVKKVFVVQGEEQSSEVLAEKIKSDIGLMAEVPNAHETVDL